jgi:cytochrome P450
MHAPSLDIDPFCQAFFDDPFPAHAAMRDAGPIVHLPRYDIHAVARYEQVRATLLDWQGFSSARGVGIEDFAKVTAWRPRSLLLETDPPLHDRNRAMMEQVLSASALRRLRAGFARVAEDMIDDLLARDEFDAITDLAEAYPLTVFPDAFGMPVENRRFLLPWGNMVFNSFGPRNAWFETAVRDAEPVLDWVMRQSLRENLAPGGIGAAIHAFTDHGDLTPEEAAGLTRGLLTAGVDTTVNGLGAAVYCLARFPDQLALLNADPALARSAFEEAVRLESPVQTFFRTATRKVTIGDVALEEGAKLLMFLGAANRDPRQWERADTYDITRKTVGHVGFGTGIHSCVGAVLARMEGELVLATIARKVARIEITAPPTRRYNNTLRGLSHLPTRLHPR